MPSFVHESLLWWGLPLVGLPVLIHLINLMRHRRVPWAAMEFLLASQKRHQRSILFKQWLLLLLRMLAMAAVVFMIAQPLVRNRIGGLLGGGKTHHIILLDDSFSMSDHWADTSGFDEAKQVVARLAAQAGHQDTPQIITLLRFSLANRLASGAQPDLVEEPIDADFQTRLEEVLGRLTVSETAFGAEEALAAIERLGPQDPDENRVVYLVTDFRANNWQEPAALREALARLDTSSAKLHLIDCVDAMHSNLAVTSLRCVPGTRAAGVPLLVEVAVRNFGPGNKERISISLEEDGQPRPAVVIEEIPSGRIVTRRFPVLFTTAGEHTVAARLETDAVAVDNARSLVIDMPKAVEVLVVDGDPEAVDAFFLTSALAPGGKTASGLKPLVESPHYLRDHALDQFDTIYLLNVPRLEAAEISALESFVKSGGGLGIFLGERVRAELVNDQLYRGGEGVFPLPLAGPAELAVDRLEKAPDLEVTDHPMFAVFAGERNSFLNLVTINRYFAAEKDWSPDPDSTTRIIARLRNKAPLAVERTLGEGRVVAILTKASPAETSLGSWNNWGRDNPSFVVAMLELQSYLAAPRHPDTSRVVGTPLAVDLDPARYLPQAQFLLPRETLGERLTVDAIADKTSGTAVLADTFQSGIYRVKLTATDNSERVEQFAFNVESDEGNLKRIESAQLSGRLQGVGYEYHRSGDINYNPQQLAGVNLSETLLYLLIAVLAFESVMAYVCSYHPPAKEGAR